MPTYDPERDEPEARHTGTRRNRVRIPKSDVVFDDIPVDPDFRPWKMTSSDQGLGLKVCRAKGSHDLVRVPLSATGQDYVCCRRCGQLVLQHFRGR